MPQPLIVLACFGEIRATRCGLPIHCGLVKLLEDGRRVLGTNAADTAHRVRIREASV
jgi:hypothetical protein